MLSEAQQLPAGWRVSRLGDIAAFTMGRTPARARSEYWSQDPHSGVPWVSIGDMRPLGVVSETAERITARALEEVFRGRLTKKRSLLMSFKLTIGRIATLGVDACHNEAIVAIEPTREANQTYLGYFLSQVNYSEYQDRAIKGHTLNLEKINRIEVALPPLTQQERIAAVLRMVQRSIEIEDKLLATVGELKQAAMRELFTRGLHGEAQKETDVGPLPESWGISPVHSKARVIAGGTPSRHEARYWNAGTIPWVKTGEIDYRVITDTEEKITPEGLAESAAKLLPRDTVLVAMYGQGVTRGRVALLGIEAATNQACVGLIPLDGGLLPRFLYYYLVHSYERLRSLSHGAQQQNLNAELVGSFPVPLPQPAEQREIASILGAVDEKVSVHERKRAVLQDLFKTLLTDLMSGRIRVADLDIDVSEVTAA